MYLDEMLLILKSKSKNLLNLHLHFQYILLAPQLLLFCIYSKNEYTIRNMIAAARLLSYEHMQCIVHILQRSITVSLADSGFVNALSKCHKIVGHFKHSPANTLELNTEQENRMQVQQALIQDVPTRWNSTLDMVKRLIRNKDAVTGALDQQNHKLVMLTQQEWDKLQRLESLLEPCK